MVRGSLTRGFSLVVAILLCLTFVSGLSWAFPSHTDNQAAPSPTDSVYGVDVDPDVILLSVALQPDGTGEWRVEYRVRLDDENSTEAFERHRDQIESDPETYRDRFANDMRATVETAEDATGREMSLDDPAVDVSTEAIPQHYGVISYTFEWNGFATTADSTIEAGYALEGIFLTQETTLIVTWPHEYHQRTVSPAPHDVRDRGVVWSGAMHFAGDEPRIVVSQEAAADTADGQPDDDPVDDPVDDPGDDPVDDPVEDAGPNLVLLAVIGLAGALIAGLGGAVYLGIVDHPFRKEPTEGSHEDTAATELMSNEEQVQTLLEERGGRVKQQEVAAELGWTDAKTSKVVRQMRDEGAIDTFRIGRENVVTLPDTDLEDSG